jgi:hypothetical protein
MEVCLATSIRCGGHSQCWALSYGLDKDDIFNQDRGFDFFKNEGIVG